MCWDDPTGRANPAVVVLSGTIPLSYTAESVTGGEPAGVHQGAVDRLSEAGVFEGTGCGTIGELCPNDPILRWETAVWLVRVLDGTDQPETTGSRFYDVDETEWWAPYTVRLSDLAVTAGCATEPLRFCPNRPVTRGQMAAFLRRAFSLPPGPAVGFADVSAGHIFETDINSLAAVGITVGCASNPPRYCPTSPVTRGQMATLLDRALRQSDTHLTS